MLEHNLEIKITPVDKKEIISALRLREDYEYFLYKFSAEAAS